MKTNKPTSKKKITLTNREKEVVYWLAQGLTSKKIADQLGISFYTVEDYRKSLLRKFNTHTTVGMVVKATKMKW